MSNPSDWNLKNSPFQHIANEAEATVWAGMPKVKSSIDDIIRSVMPNNVGSSEFVTIYGEYGGGKTHALRYFEREIKDKGYGHTFFVGKARMSETLRFAEIFNSVISKESDTDFFRQLAKKIRESIKSQMLLDSVTEHEEIIDSKFVASNRPMVQCLWDIGKNESERSLHPYLQVKATDDYGAALKLAALLSVMTTPIGEQPAPYPAVYFFIDEMEDVFEVKLVQTLSFFNALRELINNVPEHFALICAYGAGAAYLEAQLPIAIQDRQTRPIVELPPLSNDDAKIFIREYLVGKRIKEMPIDSFFPFSEGAIDALLELHNEPYPRRIILGMRRIFERATRSGEVQPMEEISKEIAEKILSYE